MKNKSKKSYFDSIKYNKIVKQVQLYNVKYFDIYTNKTKNFRTSLSYGHACNIRDTLNSLSPTNPFWVESGVVRELKATKKDIEKKLNRKINSTSEGFEVAFNDFFENILSVIPNYRLRTRNGRSEYVLQYSSEWLKKTEAKRIKDHKPESKFPVQGSPLYKYDYEPHRGDYERIQNITKALSAIWTPSPKSSIIKPKRTRKKHNPAKFERDLSKTLFQYYLALLVRSGQYWHKTHSGKVIPNWKLYRYIAKAIVYGNFHDLRKHRKELLQTYS